MNTLKIEIVTPEKLSFSQEADQVSLPTASGEITVLPGHMALVTKLLPGEVRIKNDNQSIFLAIGNGFAEINGEKVSLVTDLAERPEEIDEKAAQEAKKRAEEALADKERLSHEEFAAVAAALQKALVQLRLKRKHFSKTSLRAETTT